MGTKFEIENVLTVHFDHGVANGGSRRVTRARLHKGGCATTDMEACPETVLASGQSICARADKYSGRRGQYEALKHVLATMDGPLRKQIWSHYFAKYGTPPKIEPSPKPEYRNAALCFLPDGRVRVRWLTPKARLRTLTLTRPPKVKTMSLLPADHLAPGVKAGFIPAENL